MLMLALLPLSLALGALFYISLAVWRATVEGFRPSSMLLALAFAGMAARSAASLQPSANLQILAECLSNALWVGYLWFVVRDDLIERRQRFASGLPIALLIVALARAASLFFTVSLGGSYTLALILALSFCIGALVLLHGLHSASHRRASGFRLILVALAILWAYDLNLYVGLLLQLPIPVGLVAGRGVIALMLAPVLGVAARRKQQWQIAVSRKVAFQSLSLVAIGGYFVLASTIASTRFWLGSTISEIGTVTALTVVSGLAIPVLASSRTRAQVKVLITKHLFAHRYDYRAEWLRFNATINSGSLTGLSPEQRAIKALADLMEADGGLLFVRQGRDWLHCAAAFNWNDHGWGGRELTLSPGLLNTMETESHIMISPHYGGESGVGEFPDTLPIDGSIWIAVPLVQMTALVGLVALGRPRIGRQLDWEDFDLLKVLGQQIATYIADSQRQGELEEARQFEEFNRRFAFIVHDIKNVVSQLSLVAANASEHGANPRFQLDMASTLQNSVGKMTNLLNRLSPDRALAQPMIEAVDATALIKEIVDGRQNQHPVRIADGDKIIVKTDRARLHTALDHLVQNAVEASASGSPVILSVKSRNDKGVISVHDTGVGMSPEFVRTQLFKPFASTKPGGFGIGAGEARALVRQMGGELEVQSMEGVGTSFIITLPVARNLRGEDA